MGSRGLALFVVLAGAACAHDRPLATATAPRVEEGVVTELEGDFLVVRTADEAPVAMPFDLAADPEVLFDDTRVGTGALIEGASVRVFYRGEGDVPATVERIEILSGEEGAAVRARAARPGPAAEEDEILEPRTSPAPDVSPGP
jgi:hypothetical protein